MGVFTDDPQVHAVEQHPLAPVTPSPSGQNNTWSGDHSEGSSTHQEQQHHYGSALQAYAPESAHQQPTLPRMTRVLIAGNNRTKRSLVGQEAVVKKAVGLGGWHHIVLASGEELKLQRNALTVIEYGPPDDMLSSDEDEETRDNAQIEIMTKPRVRRPPKALSPAPEVRKRPGGVGPFGAPRAQQQQQHYSHFTYNNYGHMPAVDFGSLSTSTLLRYCRAYGLPEEGLGHEELVAAVRDHWQRSLVDEAEVLLSFARAVRRRTAVAA